MRLPNTERGFAHILIFVIGVLVLGATVVVIWLNRGSTPQSAQAPTEVPATLPSQSSSPKLTASAKPLVAKSSTSDTCGANCQAEIDKQIADLRTELLAQINQNSSTQPTLSTVTGTSSKPNEYFVTIGGSDSSHSTDWVVAAGTTISFDPSKYPGAKAFYFEANLVSDAPDLAVYARLYDVTHSIGVANSDINFTGLTSTFKQSGALNFASGATSFSVQIHSLNGNLATVQNPRIRVSY